MERITYQNNNQLWAIENAAAAAGYKKTDDCYWAQIFRNEETGHEFGTTREEDSTNDPAADLSALLNPAKESNQPAERVSISAGNIKMGAIPSVSLPPVVTCPKNAPCAKKCYAAKICRLRPSVRAAYDRNLRILKADPAAYWAQVRAAAMVSRYFRFHVSGDIPDSAYMAEMVKTAADIPGTQFLCFTKKYNIVNDFILNGGEIPENLHLIFSEWGKDFTPYNPYSLPTAAVIFKGEKPRDGWKVCGGNCTNCACQGVGCWELKKGETIAFYEH